MNTDVEKRWERMQQLLFAEARGDAPVRIASQRTLFGIKSTVEQQIDRIVAEEEARLKAKREQDGSSTPTCIPSVVTTPVEGSDQRSSQ